MCVWGNNSVSLAQLCPIISKILKMKTIVTDTVIIRFVIPVVFINKLYWSVCICLTQLYLMVKIRIEFITQRTPTCFGTLHWPSSV